MASQFATVEDYLASLPDDRREAIAAVRAVILKNLPKGFEEGIQYNMIGYYVPHSLYPAGYHCNPSEPLPFISLASQKSHMAVYMFCIYSSEEMTSTRKPAREWIWARVVYGLRNWRIFRWSLLVKRWERSLWKSLLPCMRSKYRPASERRNSSYLS